MKVFVVLLLTALALPASAILESHYGKISNRGFKYTCSLRNNSNHTMDMKYVVFTFERSSGENPDFEVQERIDQRVRSGEVITASVTEPQAWAGRHCRFLER